MADWVLAVIDLLAARYPRYLTVTSKESETPSGTTKENRPEASVNVNFRSFLAGKEYAVTLLRSSGLLVTESMT
ncbi:MAG: hypothetical protein QMB03_02710, partial [Spirosomataceae bacterium]